MRKLDYILNNFIGFAAALVLLAIVLSLTSCRTIQVVPEIHTEYIHDTISRVDSVWRDRVHTEYQRGDTIILRDSVYLYQYKTLDKVVEVIKRDSIPYAVEVEKQVRYVPGFYKWSTWVLWLLIAAFIIYVACRVVRFIYLRK